MAEQNESSLMRKDIPQQEVHDQEIREHIAGQDDHAGNISTLTWIAIASMMFTYATSLGSYLCIVPVIGIINEDIGPSDSYSWMATSWAVTGAVTLLVIGALSDVFGRRWFTVSVGILGVIAGIVGVTAQSVGQVIGAMAILGMNQAGALATFAFVAELVPTKLRGLVLGIENALAGVFVLGGSVFGHLMSVNTAPGWRSLFYLVIATQGASAILIVCSYFPGKPLATQGRTSRQILANFDYVGLLGITAGPTLFLVGISYIPIHGATDARFLAPFLVGCVVIVATGIWEAFFSKEPLLHPFLFKRIRSFVMLNVVAFVGGMLFYALVAFWPTFLETVIDGDMPIQVGIHGIPYGAGTQLGGVGSAMLLPFLGPKVGTQWMLTFGVALQVIFIPLLAVVDPNDRSMALAFSFFGGIGIGIAELLSILLIQLATPDEWIGFATGTLGLIRNMGGATGTSIYSSIFQSKAQVLVPQYVAEAALPAGLPQASLPALLGVLTGQAPESSLAQLNIDPAIIEESAVAAREAYAESFRYVWYTSIAFGIVALACAASTKDLSARLTSKIAQRMTVGDSKRSAGSIDLEKPTVQHVDDKDQK